jgi:hypothetical protein
LVTDHPLLTSVGVLPALATADRVARYFTNVFNDKDAVERAYVVRRTGARAGGDFEDLENL